MYISINHDDLTVCTFCAFLHVSLYRLETDTNLSVFCLFNHMCLRDLNLSICCCNKKRAQYIYSERLFRPESCSGLWIIPDSPNRWVTTEMNPAHWGKRSHPLTYIPTLSFGYWTRFWLLTFA